MRIPSLLALPLALAVSACGALASHTDEPSTLATIRGQVTNPDSVPVGQGGFRVAVVWSTFPESGPNLARVAQETAVTPVFPAQFALDIKDPPPDDAINHLKDAFTPFAYGTIVAYEDVNGNGKLDLVDFGATSFVDRIVAARYDLTILFLEKVPSDPAQLKGAADDNGAVPTAGYNFYLLDDCKHGGCDSSKPGFTWLPITASITLPVSNDPQLSALMCASASASGGASGSVTDHPPGQYPAQFPAKGDPNLRCAADNRSYTYQQCTESRQGLCGEATRACLDDTYVVPTGNNPPTGWPCGQ